MTLNWNVSDDPEHSPMGNVLRHKGSLLGRLDDLLPCIFLAQSDASMRDMHMRHEEKPAGVFVLGRQWHRAHSHVIPCIGLILPLRLCNDETLRAALSEIPALVNDGSKNVMAIRRYEVQARLDAAFGGDVTISRQENIDGFFGLEPGPAFFSCLHKSFEYVTEVLDNPADAIHVARSTPFPWRSYAELMEWFYSKDNNNRFGTWRALTPFFVSGSTGASHYRGVQRRTCTRLHRPSLEPSKWFVLRPGLPNARLSIGLQMEKYGWAALNLSIDEANLIIDLSVAYCPFDDLVAWGHAIDEGDIPIQMEIDEEGQEVVLTVLPTDHPSRVWLHVTRKYSDEILLEGIVARTDLAITLKNELRRFFTSEFDPRHWDASNDDLDDGGNDPGDDDDEDATVRVKERVLSHAWLTAE